MKPTEKRFWNWRTLIVVLIISLLIAFFKRCMTTNTADIERVGNEIIVMIDDFQKMNNRLPIGLNEIGTPFEGINETYEYKDYIFYYEPRKDGFYWLTVTFGPDENYCYNSKNKSWIWDYDSERVEMYKKFDTENDLRNETDR